MNIKQSNEHMQRSNLDPSNDTLDNCTESDINTSNDAYIEPSNGMVSSKQGPGWPSQYRVATH